MIKYTVTYKNDGNKVETDNIREAFHDGVTQLVEAGYKVTVENDQYIEVYEKPEPPTRIKYGVGYGQINSIANSLRNSSDTQALYDVANELNALRNFVGEKTAAEIRKKVIF